VSSETSLAVYRAEAVHAGLPWAALAQAIADAFANPGVTAPTRHAHGLSERDALLLMPAWDERLIVTKLVTVLPAAEPTVQATLIALDRASGRPLALIDGEAVTLRRTAATSAWVAARLAARRERLLLVGAGALAPWMARAYLALVPDLATVEVWARQPARAVAVAAALAATPEAAGRPVTPAADLPTAVGHADMICCATTATEPIVHGAWLTAGTHLDLVGGFRTSMREIDDAAIMRAFVLVDTYAGALKEAGDLVVPLEHGILERERIFAELSGWVRNPIRPSTTGADLTLFKSVGTAIEDLAAVRCLLAPAARH